MHYLYDMGYYINRSLHHIIKEYTKTEYTPFSHEFAIDVANDVKDSLQWEIKNHSDPSNQFHLCFDDKDNQIRPEYKQRQTCPLHYVVKYLAQELLLYDWPDCPAEKHVGYGWEADDWIYQFRCKNSEKRIQTQIHTSDGDLLCNIDEFTTIVFHKTTEDFYINTRNWDYMIGNVFPHAVPYNAVWLYKITVGDTSDHIAGIRGFGKKAFEKMLKIMDNNGVDYNSLATLDGFEEFLLAEDGLQKYLTEDQLRQALDAWSLVCPIVVGHDPVKTVEIKKEEIER